MNRPEIYANLDAIVNGIPLIIEHALQLPDDLPEEDQETIEAATNLLRHNTLRLAEVIIDAQDAYEVQKYIEQQDRKRDKE